MSDRDEEYDDYDRPRRESRGLSAWVIVLIVGAVLAMTCLVVVPVLLLPLMVQTIHVQSERAMSQSKLKQIAIGFHSYNGAHSQLPMPYFQPPNGEPPADPSKRLSWRYSLLPYIEQGALYERFRPDEAWDSPTNRTLSQTSVPTYLDPGEPPGNQTRYRVFVGNGALFDANPSRPLKLTDIADGTANTIFAVEANVTVPWAQYNELPFDPNVKPFPLGKPGAGGFNAAMADGSVRYIRSGVNPQLLNAAITRAGGEALPPGWDAP
jgi:prepilin-type processing-associated H-X9-DG protein